VVYRDDLLSPSVAGPIIPNERESPPEDLTPRQREIWIGIVADLDRDWFSDTRPLLTELVAHIDYAGELRRAIERVRDRLAEMPAGSAEEKALSRQLASLLRQHSRQSSSIAHLSTKLRLTPQTRQSARRADQVRRRTGRRPWEGWQAD
jgi:hypothetical protein